MACDLWWCSWFYIWLKIHTNPPFCMLGRHHHLLLIISKQYNTLVTDTKTKTKSNPKLKQKPSLVNLSTSYAYIKLVIRNCLNRRATKSFVSVFHNPLDKIKAPNLLSSYGGIGYKLVKHIRYRYILSNEIFSLLTTHITGVKHIKFDHLFHMM